MRTNAKNRHGAQHAFDMIPRAETQRSAFDRSAGVKTTMNGGYLYPLFVDEILPGDTINLRPVLFARMNTLIFPIIDNVWLTAHAFFVPNRLLWDKWQRFNGEQPNPGDSTDFLTPQITSPTNGFARYGLLDYMGVPPQATPGTTHSVIAFYTRAYNRVWNDWYRDQNLQNALTVDTGDGPDSETNYTLKRRNKKHDYFTSGLPWPQKGTAVTLPLGTQAPVNGLGFNANLTITTENNVRQSDGTTSTFTNALDMATGANIGAMAVRVKTNSATAFPDVYADLTGATASTINQIRTAFQLQRLFERDARGGTRYTEILRSHFNVISPDARLQRSEYLGGGQINVAIHPVTQTAEGAATMLGSLAGYGVAVGEIPNIVHSFTEHGVLLVLVSIRADLNYQQGANRMWHRRTRWDYFWPALAHLGEQAVESREIYIDGTGTPPSGTTPGTGDWSTFSYQERYAEYRYRPSLITSTLRTSDPLTLDSWHLAQNFSSRPTLNDTFIQDNPPFTRVVATPTEPIFYVDGYFQYTHVRPIPAYGVPGLIDHF